MIRIYLQGDFCRCFNMLKKIILGGFCLVISALTANAQVAALNEAKYITTLKVITDHKMNDADLVSDIDKLRQNEYFIKDLKKMMAKLDNDRPNSAKNLKIKRILERAGKDIYNELK